jgi:hypothetical protein
MYTVSRSVENYPLYNCSDSFDNLKAARKAYTWLLDVSQGISLMCGEIVLQMTETRKDELTWSNVDKVIRKHVIYLTKGDPIVERERTTQNVDGTDYPIARVFYGDKWHEVIALYEGYGCKPSDDKRFLFGHEYGPTHLVISDSRHNAYEAVIEASFTVTDTTDIVDDDENGLQDGYTYQSNFKGTGIVETLYLWCVEWDNAAKEWSQCKGT